MLSLWLRTGCAETWRLGREFFPAAAGGAMPPSDAMSGAEGEGEAEAEAEAEAAAAAAGEMVVVHIVDGYGTASGDSVSRNDGIYVQNLISEK